MWHHMAGGTLPIVTANFWLRRIWFAAVKCVAPSKNKFARWSPIWISVAPRGGLGVTNSNYQLRPSGVESDLSHMASQALAHDASDFGATRARTCVCGKLATLFVST